MSDIRKQRTLHNIDSTIYQLLTEMSFSDISVTKICQHAELGRSTFYQYYFDKYDWLEKHVSLYSERLKSLLNQRFHGHQVKMDLVALMNELWKDHQQLTLLFNVHTPEADLAENFQSILSQYFSKFFQLPKLSAAEFDFLSKLYGSTAFTNIKWSMANGISPEINQMMDESVKSFIKNFS